MRAAIGDGEEAALLSNYEHLLAVVPYKAAAIAAELAAFQPSHGKHFILLIDRVIGSEARQISQWRTIGFRLLCRPAPRYDVNYPRLSPTFARSAG